MFREECGLPVNTYFSMVKMMWLIENSEEVRAAQEKGNLRFGTVDTWIIYRLTKGESYVTDSSNASRTMLMNLHTLEWSEKMLQESGIKRENLPEIKKASAADFGTISDLDFLQGVKIGGVLGDQQASCLGHTLQKGEVKNTYGTGCFILMNVGDKVVQSTHGLLSTVCYSVKEGEVNYALEGAVETAGAAISWAKRVGLVDLKTIEAEARSV